MEACRKESLKVAPPEVTSFRTARRGMDCQLILLQTIYTKHGRKLTSLVLGLAAKRVQRERRGVDAVGDGNGLSQAVDGENGEGGAKGLLLDHGVVHGVDEHGGGLDEQIGLVHLAAHD